MFFRSCAMAAPHAMPTPPTQRGRPEMTRIHAKGSADPTGTTTGPSRRGFLLGAVGAGLATTSLAACSSGESGGSGGSDIVFMNQSRGQAATLKKLAQQYTKQTGVKIRIDDVGPAD